MSDKNLNTLDVKLEEIGNRAKPFGGYSRDLLNVGRLSSYHPHFQIEVLFLGTIFKNSIYIYKTIVFSQCWCCGRVFIDIRNMVRIPGQIFIFFETKKGIRTKTANS